MQNRVTYLVHGIHSEDRGASTVVRVAPYLSQHSVIVNAAYGYIGPVGAIFKNRKIARRLMLASSRNNCEGNHAVGHSNGCAIIVEALRQGAKFKSILLINPALKANTVFPSGDYTITVIHTKHDRAVRAARFFDAIPFLGTAISLTKKSWG